MYFFLLSSLLIHNCFWKKVLIDWLHVYLLTYLLIHIVKSTQYKKLAPNKFSTLMWFARFLNSNKLTPKHLVQGSCTELTLLQWQYCVIYMDFLGYSIIFHIYEQNVKKSLMIEAKNCEGGIWIVWNSIILFSLPSNNRCDMIKI